MSGFAVPTPILNGPFDEPAKHWHLEPGEPPEERTGRRPAGYFYRDPTRGVQDAGGSRGIWREMPLANLIRDRLREWQQAGRPGITRTTQELIGWWTREGRHPRLFFAQREAVETVIFLTEARPDFLQGIDIPPDPPSEDRIAEGFTGFRRTCAKMATGTGKSTVAAMLSAWSILNKIADRGDARFSDTVLIVCPNVTIRSRLGELDPATGDASLYRTRDLVPETMMPDLEDGKIIIINWHVLEPQSPGSSGSRVEKRGVPVKAREWVLITSARTNARGGRAYTPEAYAAAKASQAIRVLKEDLDGLGNVVRAQIEATRYVESDTALVERVLKQAGGKQNILVINDEAHHAYRIPPCEPDDDDQEPSPDEGEDDRPNRKEATVWVDGLDRIHKVRRINMCVDLSATPYFLGRMGGSTNTVFPWVVSDFGLTDAIESGLVKVPQLVAADDTGRPQPAYFNIWEWIKPRLTAAERGTARGGPRPEAILKHAHTPIAMLGGMWLTELRKWAAEDRDTRPPVFILVARNKRLAKALYEWIGENRNPPGVAPLSVPELANVDGRIVTIRVDTGVVAETDSDNTDSDENRWMRLTLDTVGSIAWPEDKQARPVYPIGFEDLAEKLNRPLHPPGRDVRCIVSVGMLTEGWDCNTVTHVIGLRPFQSQLLCEQVVGRALRRRFYHIDGDGRFEEEVAKVFGVPFEVVPFKATNADPKPKPPQRRIYPVPSKSQHAITVPNVQGFQMGVRNRVTVSDWPSVAGITLDPQDLPSTSAMAAALNMNRPSVTAPGGAHMATLEAFRAERREQQLAFQMSADLTRLYTAQSTCEAPAHVLFPQLLRIVQHYLDQKVTARAPAVRLDAFLSPYYGWIIERLLAAITPDAAAGEMPEVPDVDEARPLQTADINLFTPRPVAEAARTHLNLVVADTISWEQSAGYQLDHHPAVRSFVKNSGLNFVVRYLHNGESHEYTPDFIARLESEQERYLIIELKGQDWRATAEIKAQAAVRWCTAINATARYGHWSYFLAYHVSELVAHLNALDSVPKVTLVRAAAS